mmetsp:Transcript_18411/g.42168  ORF Transcript_18411/g.42168 Transcript_18411/m.42168 type:complete len:225 (+) Transcript_18411:273-947(+)
MGAISGILLSHEPYCPFANPVFPGDRRVFLLSSPVLSLKAMPALSVECRAGILIPTQRTTSGTTEGRTRMRTSGRGPRTWTVAVAYPSYSPISPVKKVVRPTRKTDPSGSSSDSSASKASNPSTSSADSPSGPRLKSAPSSSSSSVARTVRSTKSSLEIPSGRSPSDTRASQTKGPRSRPMQCSSLAEKTTFPSQDFCRKSAAPCASSWEAKRPRTRRGRKGSG